MDRIWIYRLLLLYGIWMVALLALLAAQGIANLVCWWVERRG